MTTQPSEIMRNPREVQTGSKAQKTLVSSRGGRMKIESYQIRKSDASTNYNVGFLGGLSATADRIVNLFIV